MAQLEAVAGLPSIEREGQARVAGPIVEDFMASDLNAAKVTGTKGKAASTKAIIQKYIETREVDASVFIRQGEIYLLRGRKAAEPAGAAV